MLLDPFEEKFHLPATLVKLGNRSCVEHKVVRQEHETLACVGVYLLDPSKVGVDAPVAIWVLIESQFAEFLSGDLTEGQAIITGTEGLAGPR